ncbi:MAG: hypothetical protein WB777_19240 [Mycobacterium sp.]
MNVSKSNLVAMLSEVGEENAAVLLARSELPDEIDLDRELDSLVAFGLDRDQIDEVAELTIGVIGCEDDNAHRRRDEMEKTISRRWADLVDHWLR